MIYVSVFNLDVFLPLTSQVVNCIQLSSLVERQDRRVSGSSLIDEQLQGVVSLVVRDFVLSWYNNLSTHQAFITHLHRTIQHSMVILANRLVFLCPKPYFFLFLKVMGKKYFKELNTTPAGAASQLRIIPFSSLALTDHKTTAW